MTISNKLKERFCKNYKLPIKIFDEPYFESRLNLLDPLYDCIYKYEMFKNDLSNYKNEEEYFATDNEVLDNVINSIKNTPEYIQFNSWTLPEMDLSMKKIFEKNSKEIYTSSNIGKVLLSIDLTSANFQALKRFSPNIFYNKNTWEDYLKNFTSEYSKINSKHLRQVIFGALNPKRTVTYERYITSLLLKEIIEVENLFSETEIISTMNDEIVFLINETLPDKNNENYSELIKKIDIITNEIEKISNKLNIKTHSEIFVLSKEKDDSTYKKNLFMEDKIKFKKTNNLTLPFIVREINGEEPKEEDYVFIFEGNLCKLMKNPLNK